MRNYYFLGYRDMFKFMHGIGHEENNSIFLITKNYKLSKREYFLKVCND